jgi:hypothetical protein
MLDMGLHGLIVQGRLSIQFFWDTWLEQLTWNNITEIYQEDYLSISVLRCDPHTKYSWMLKPDVVDMVKVLLKGLSINTCQDLVHIYLTTVIVVPSYHENWNWPVFGRRLLMTFLLGLFSTLYSILRSLKKCLSSLS